MSFLKASSMVFICLIGFTLIYSQTPAVSSPIDAKLRAGGKFAHIHPKAPQAVKEMIRAGNAITNRRYRWGGGHIWRYNTAKPPRRDRGYDCSGAVSFLLQRAGLLDQPLTSGMFARWGRPGKGQWVTIYANKNHVFMVVAGLRWDTSYITDGDKSGPGWSEFQRPTKGFKVRRVWVGK
jgi:hypothetical protein